MRARLVTAVTVALVLTLALAAVVNAQAIRNVFDWVIANQLTVNNTATMTGDVTFGDDVTVTDALTVNGAATLASSNVTGNASVTGNTSLTGYLAVTGATYLIPPTTLTVTNNSVLTVTGTVLELTAAGAVGATMPNATDGRLLIVLNTANQTITITETSTAKMAGNFAMGQYDSITFVGSGVVWYELARSNN